MIEMAPSSDSRMRKAGQMDWESFFRDYRKHDFIPGYTILNKLGGGVFGEVFKAKKTSIGKFYAVKFLKIQDERLSEQVLKELDSVDHFAQVDHPSLVSIEDRGEVCGIPFIVMGYAGDETLKVLLSDGPLPRTRAITLYRQVLQGVKALHGHSIVHFDLKPANIFIKGELARVGDYGLSKLMSDSRATLSMGRGTPYYMAPEMLRRKGDARSDVYSLGIILYEMLTGEVPFKGDSEWEILKKHETEPVRIPAGTGSALTAFLRQSLDKNPDRRFRNAGAMLTAFESALDQDRGGYAPPPVGAPFGGVAPLTAPGNPIDPELLGDRAGRLAHRGKVNLERVRTGLSDILQQLSDDTQRVQRGFRNGYREASGAEAMNSSDDPASQNNGGSLDPPALPLPVRRPRRRRGPIGALFHGLFRLISLPILLLKWFFRHLVQVVVVLLVTGVLGFAIHLALKVALLG